MAGNRKRKMLTLGNIRQVFTSIILFISVSSVFFLFTDFLLPFFRQNKSAHSHTLLAEEVVGKHSITPQGMMYNSKPHPYLFHSVRSNIPNL